jgi:translocation and assembly module TamB
MKLPARRWVLWPLAILAALLLAAAIAVAWLVTTESGLRRAVTLVESLGSVSIRVTDASGRLIGPLAIGKVEIEHPRASIRISGLSADYEPLEILAGRISAEGARIRDAAVTLRQAAGPKKPPSFMPGWLTVAIDDASLDRLLIVSPNGAETQFRDIRGSARIARTTMRFDGVGARSTGWAVAGASGTLFARDPIAMDLTTAWSVSEDNFVAGVAHAIGDLERLAVDVQVAAPAKARIKAEVRDLAKELSFRGRAEIAPLDLAQWVEEPPVGPLTGMLAIEGSRLHYAVRGTLRGRGLPDDGVAVDARARWSKPALEIESLGLVAPPGLELHAAGTLRPGAEPVFDLSATWNALRWPLTGLASVSSKGGSLEARGWKEFSYRVSGEFVAAAGPPLAGEASGRYTASAIIVDASSWRVLDGNVTLAGSLGRGDEPSWSVSGRATGIDPGKLRPNLPGRLGFEFSGNGRGFEPDGPWIVRVRGLKGVFRGQPIRGHGSLRRRPGRYEFGKLSVSLGSSQLEADGIVGRGANLEGRLVAANLSEILPELGGQVDATVRLRGRIMAVRFRGHDLAYGSHRAVVLSVDARLDRQNTKHSWLRLRSNGITLGGFALSDTRLSLDGLMQDHALTFRVGAGLDAVSLRGRGGWQDERYTLALEGIAASGPRIVPWKLANPSRFTASRSDAVLEPVCLAYETRRFCVDARWIAGGEWSARASTDAFPLEALDPKRRGAPGYRGMLSIDANASGRAGAPWIASVEAEIRDASLTYQSASGADRKVALGLTRLSLESDAAHHRANLRVSDAADIELAVALTATRLPDAAFTQLPVSGTVRGRTRQLSLLPMLVDAIDNASGEAALDFTVAGRVGAPVLTGEARLTGGALDFYQTNLRLRELRSTVRLEDTSLRLEAEGKAGDGTLAVAGRLGWRDRRLNGELTVSGERLLVANVPEARVLASPALNFKLDDRRIAVTGEVAIPEATIRPADTAGAVLPSSDERVVRPDVVDGADESFAVSSDVRLVLGDKVAVKAFGLSATITGAVRTRMEPGESTMGAGELEVKEGEYSAYGRELEIERGKLVFSGGPVTDPGVDLRASRELPGYEVGVIARGPLRRPQLTLFSEPSLPQAQIASMLIVGRSSIQGDPGATDDGPSSAEQGGAILAGQLGKYVGLDDIGLTQDDDAGSQLVIGKYLSPRLYVSYGISLVEEINTLKLRYTIGDRWTLSAESGVEQAFDVEYRIED